MPDTGALRDLAGLLQDMEVGMAAPHRVLGEDIAWARSRGMVVDTAGPLSRGTTEGKAMTSEFLT